MRLKDIEIKELMGAIDFHEIPSKKKWKLKIVSITEVKQSSLEFHNRQGDLENFINEKIEEALYPLTALQRKKKMIVAFFK